MSQKGLNNKQDGRRSSSSSLLGGGGGGGGGMGAGLSRSASFRANSYEASIGGVIASCRRRGGINNMLKTLGIAKVEANHRNMPHVNVGRVNSGSLHGRAASGDDMAGEQASQKRVLGVSLLGACSSKGCPTKSVENEDRYVHGKINLDVASLRGQCKGGVKGSAARGGAQSDSTSTCWAFATFDGHAGPACAHFLRENFMEHLRKMADCRKMAAAETSSIPEAASEGNADAAAGRAEGSRPAAAGGGEDGEEGGTSDDGDDDDDEDVEAASVRRRAAVEVVLARLLTDTLASLTRAFEKSALIAGEISGACVISGLYCEGALVLANVGDCQAMYHGQVKSAPGTAVTAQTTIHDASNPSEVNRFLNAGGFLSSTGRFQGVLEPSRTVGDVDVKADAPKGSIASYPELFKVDIASDVFEAEERLSVPPFLVLATDGIWDETSANTVVEEVKDGIAKIQAHKRRFAVSEGHRRDFSLGSTTFTDGESDSEDEDEESEFCGSGEWAEQGMDLAERVVSLARGRYDDATALVVVFE